MRAILPIRISMASVAALVVCLSATIGCGTGKFFVPTCQETNSCGGGSTTYSSFAYVANKNIGTLALFPLPQATFTSLPGSSINLGAAQSAIAATPSGTFLYVATLAGSVFVYSIGTNGALTLGNNGQAVVSTFTPIWMTIDPSGNWLFLISSTINALLEYQINTSTGVLTQVGASTGIPLTVGNSGQSPTQVYVTPDNQFVYIGLGTGGVDGFTLDSSTGALSNHIHLAPRAGSDNALTADNNSAFLFVGEAGSGIRVLSINTGGSLTEVSGSPFTSQLGPRSIVVDPTNSFVYVANSTANVITGYTLGADGALTSPTTFSTGVGPYAMSLDPTGTYLLLINSGGSPDLQVFSFDQNVPGQLDPVTTAATGNDPAGAISLSVVP
jgi:6-phosphogluconolactonase